LKDFGINTKDTENLINFLQTSDINIIKKYLKEKSAKEELFKLEKILLLLENSFGIKNSQIQMSIVRGLDYYKGLVFEIEAPILGAEKQLCGGGAYDLISLFGGRDSPTAGFAIGFDRTIVTLESEEFNFPETKIDVFIISLDNDLIEKSISIAQSLREQGLTVDIDLMRRGLGKSLKYASSINAKNVAIIGSNEVKQDSVTIRNMETGDQKMIKIKDIKKNIR
jgi:histidyl-tRNA synthetase